MVDAPVVPVPTKTDKGPTDDVGAAAWSITQYQVDKGVLNPRSSWWTLFRSNSGYDIEDLANDDRYNVDPVELLSVLISLYGNDANGFSIVTAAKVAKSLAKRKPEDDLDTWFDGFAPTFARQNGITLPTGGGTGTGVEGALNLSPSTYIDMTSYVPPAPDYDAPTKAAGGTTLPSRPKTLNRIFKKYPGWRQVWGAIQSAAAVEEYKQDPLEVLSVLIAAGFDPKDKNLAAKINRVVISMADPSTGIVNFPTLDDWFAQFYGDTGGGLTPAGILKNAQVTRPAQPAQNDLGDQFDQDRKDPVLHVAKDGTVLLPGDKGYAGADELNVPGGQGGIRVSQWAQAKSQWRDFFIYYGYNEVPDKYLSKIIRGGLGEYSVSLFLTGDTDTEAGKTRRAKFLRSPAWKTHGAGYKALWEQVYGRAVPIDNGLLVKAIVNGWDDGTFMSNLRKRPDWVQSETHKQERATLRGVYEGIYGRPDEAGRESIQEATLAGWSPEQFQQWLRAQPEYGRSLETRNKIGSFANLVAQITGVSPTYDGSTRAPLLPGDKSAGQIPDDPRTRATPGLQDRAPLPPAGGPSTPAPGAPAGPDTGASPPPSPGPGGGVTREQNDAARQRANAEARAARERARNRARAGRR